MHTVWLTEIVCYQFTVVHARKILYALQRFWTQWQLRMETTNELSYNITQVYISAENQQIKFL